jgi:hypothetical protein
VSASVLWPPSLGPLIGAPCGLLPRSLTPSRAHCFLHALLQGSKWFKHPRKTLVHTNIITCTSLQIVRLHSFCASTHPP